jgi:hypothetical protein
MRELGFGVKLDGRVDLHPGAEDGSDSGAVGDPRVFARAGTSLSDALELGLELSLWLPGGDAPSVAFDAASVDARALMGIVVADGVIIDVSAGYRLDNSAQAFDAPERLSPPDRISLGLSDFDAVLLGVGGSVRLDSLELLAELTAEPLVGSGGPGFSKSALRADLGVRAPVSEGLWVGGLGEASLSGRPDVAAGSPLVPVEPRFSVLATVAYAFDLSDRPAPAERPPPDVVEPDPPKPTEPPPVAEKTERDVVIRIHDKAGKPIVDAEVRVVIGEREFPATVVEGDVYRADGVVNGSGRLIVSASGFGRVEQEITARGDTMDLEVELEPATQMAQLRGLIRAFTGDPIAAKIRVQPGDRELTADSNGTFTVDLDPGAYQVTISADGYRDQRRTVRVERGGVMILNSELLKE